MKETIILKEHTNTRIGWEQICNEIQSISLSSSIQIVINITFDNDPLLESGDITNLKYLFPIIDYLSNYNVEYKLVIKSSSSKNDNIERILQFLSKTHKRIFIDEAKSIYLLSSKFIDDINKLQGHKRIWMEEIASLRNVLFDSKKEYGELIATNPQKRKSSKKIDTIFDNIQISEKDSTNLRNIYINGSISYEEFDNVVTSIKNNLQKYVEQFDYSFKFFMSQNTKTTASNITPIIKVSSNSFNINDLIVIYSKYLSNTKHFTGHQFKRLKEIDKKRLVSRLNSLVLEVTKKEDSLIRLIFLVMLRNYIQRKEIFSFINNEYDINTSTFNKIYADAKSYAEGITQIIENSLLYSYGRSAYFFIRIYNADRTSAMSYYEKNSINRIRIYKKYHHCLARKKSGEVKSENIFNDTNYSDYLEMCVLDNAINKVGILPHYNNKLSDTSKKIQNISDLINESEDEYCSRNPGSDVEEYYISHYGLRWFNKIIEKNNGCLSILSPNNTGASYYFSPNTQESSKSFCIPEYVFSTEHNVLIPLSYKWQAEKDYRLLNVNKNIYGDNINYENYDFTSVKIGTTDINNGKNKLEAIERLYEGKISNTNSCVIYNLFDDFSISNIEIFTKSLFLKIYRTYIENNQRKLYIAVHFGDNKHFINEFVRVFSIFYNKVEQNKYMEGVQIALCSTTKSGDPIADEVNFMLGGADFESAYSTANSFVYYDAESSAEFVPLLKYLSNSDNSSKKESKEISLFPFDLYLKNCDGHSWFLVKMNNILTSNIQNRPYGCKIPNTHIRISSRLHLDTFYEAELLFHNISIVYRFAYLIAKDIINGLKSNPKKKIVILGYENYSSVLIQQIAQWINNAYKDTDTDTDTDTDETVLSAIATNINEQDTKLQFFNNYKRNDEYFCYTIIPIGTTMSTIYKIHNAFIRNCPNTVFGENFAIVCVSDSNYIKDSTTNDYVVNKYWNSIDLDKKTIKINPEHKTEEGISVNFILIAPTKWHNVNNCELCKKNIPLIQVDKTSTIPNSIFELKNNNRKFVKGYETNLDGFKPVINKNMDVSETVKYAHLKNGNNHYQFYFDYKELVKNNEKDIINWAKSIPIDNNAYNIVISPLNLSNAHFLKLVIDNVFSSSLRFLHIDINNTYKEDIRAKFSYIAKDFELIKQINNNAKIRFYYIDDSIVTGQTINRGRMLLKLISNEVEHPGDEEIFFEKVFLLLNRSSYDTAATFVKNVEKDFCCYYSIEVPSYNTNSNFCPGCSVQRQYSLLLKRTASVGLSTEFLRLSEKHKARTLEEYEEWIEEKILESNNYFMQLISYLFMVNDDNDFIAFLKEVMIEFLCNKYRTTNEPSLNKFVIKHIDNINSLNIEQFIIENKQINDKEKADKENVDKEKVINLVKYIIACRAYTRLVTMNNAYSALNRVNLMNSNEHDTEKIIYDLLKKAKDPEEIISYLKVISREHLSKYYHVRLAISNIMVEILKALIYESTSQNSTINSIMTMFNKKKNFYFKYDLLITIIHRLSMLQTPLLLSNHCASNVLNYLEKYYNQYIELFNNSKVDETSAVFLMPIKTKEKMIGQYMKSIKTATMLNKDDVLCNKLLELSEDLTKGE